MALQRTKKHTSNAALIQAKELSRIPTPVSDTEATDPAPGTSLTGRAWE